MRFEILEVCFPEPVADRILARGISEEDVLEALQADPDLGDATAAVLRGG